MNDGFGDLTNLGDFLDVFNRFQPHFDLTEGGHITSICGRCPQRRWLGRNASKTSSSEHGDEGKEIRVGLNRLDLRIETALERLGPSGKSQNLIDHNVATQIQRADHDQLIVI